MNAEKELKKAKRKPLDYLMLFSMLIFDIGFVIFRLFQGADSVVLIALPLLALFEIFLILMLLPGKLEFDFRAAMRPYYIVFALPLFAYIVFGLIFHPATIGVFYIAAGLRAALYSLFLILSSFEKLARNVVAVVLCFMLVFSIALSANAVAALFEPDIGFAWKWPLKRTLEYTFDQQSDSFVVTGIYSGIGGSVEIPETYAGKRVSGIAENAFKGDSFVTDIVIEGQAQSAVFASEKSQTQRMSFFSSEVQDNTFFIGDNAFADCEKLQTVTVNVAPTLGKNIFSGSTSLQKVEFTAPDAGAIDPEAFSGISETTQIATNPESTDTFRVAVKGSPVFQQIAPKVDENTVFVNFADPDFYVKTVTLTRGEKLTSEMLQTSDGKSLFADTVAGAAKDYTHQGLKEGYTLSGWYTSATFTGQAVKFSDLANGGSDGTVVSQSMTLYPKRLQIFTAELKNGFSDTVLQTVLFTSEDTKSLPEFPRDGYNFTGWQDSQTKQPVQNIALNSNKSFVFEATWELLKPTVNLSTNKDDNTMEYALNKSLTISVDVQHDIRDELSYSYQWYFGETPLEGKTGDTLSVSNVNESGKYTCLVVATSKTYQTDTAASNAVVEVSITPQKIGIVWDIDDFEEFSYNKQEVLPTARFSSQNEVELELSEVVYKLANGDEVAAPTNVGHYTASVELISQSDNYQIDASVAHLEFSIIPAEIEVDLSNQQATYTKSKPTVGQVPGTDFTIRGTVFGDDSLGMVIDLEAKGENWDVGSYRLFATSTNANYKATFNEAVFQVTKATLTATIDNASKVYDGTTAVKGTFSYTGLQPFSGDDVAVVGEYNSANVGATTITLSLGGSKAGNYQLVADTISAGVSITPRKLTVANFDTTKTYDGTADIKSGEVLALVGVVEKDIASVSVTGQYESANASQAATIKFTLHGASGNYEFDTGADETTGTIIPATLTVKSFTTTKEYDGDDEVKETLEFTTNLFSQGSELDDVTVIGTFNSKNVGANTITLSLGGSKAGNYELQGATISVDVSITPKELTVADFTTTKTYDGTTALNSSVTLGLTGVILADSGNVTVSGAYNSKDVNTATTISFTLAGAQKDNYKLQAASRDGSITKADLTLSGIVSATVITFGDTLFDSILSGTVNGITGEDNISGSWSWNNTSTMPLVSDSNNTPYAVTFTSSNPNYNDLTTATAKLTVNRLAVALTWDVPSNLTYTDSVPTITATVSNKVTGYDVTVTVGVQGDTGGINVGNHTMQATALSDSANYTLSGATNPTKSYTITAYSITGTNGLTHTGTFEAHTYTGAAFTPGLGNVVVKNDTFSLITGTWGTVKNVGDQITFTANGNFSGTYTIASGSGMQAAVLTLSKSTFEDKIYNGNREIAGVTLVGVQGGEDVTISSILHEKADVGNNQTITVTIDYGSALANNYSFTEPSAKINIVQAVYNLNTAPAVTSQNGTTYGKALSNWTISENVTGFGTWAWDDDSLYPTVGNSGYNATFTLTNTNYKLEDGTGVAADGKSYTGIVTGVEVEKATLTVSDLTMTRTYNGSASIDKADVSLVGIFNSDNVEIDTIAYNDKNVGSGKTITVTLTGDKAGNYKVDTISGGEVIVATLTLTGTITKVYDGTKTATATLATSSIMNGDSGKVSIKTATYAQADVGTSITVSFTLDGEEAGNYTLPSSTGSITKATLAVASFDTTKVYDGDDEVKVALTFNETLFSQDGTPDDVTVIGTFNSKNVGATTITLSLGGSKAGNYQLVADTIDSGVEITPRALTVANFDTTKTYDGTRGIKSGEVLALVGVVEKDIASVSVTGWYNVADVTANEIEFSLNDPTGNYEFDIDADKTTGTITPATLTVADFDTTKTYDGTTALNSSVTLGLTGVILADSGNVTVSGAYNSANVLEADTITLSLGGSKAGNYKLQGATISVDVSITPKELTVADFTTTKTYDGTKGLNSAVTSLGFTTELFSQGGVQDIVTVTGEYASANASQAATIKFTLHDASGNYKFAAGESTREGTITPATLAVASFTTTKEYDGTTNLNSMVSLGFTTELFSQDGVQDTVTVTGAYNSANVSEANTITLTLGGTQKDNYELQGATIISGVRITSKDVSISGASPTKTYDGKTAMDVSGFTLTGLVDGDTSVYIGSATFDSKNVGTGKTITFALAGNDFENYSLTTTTTTFGTITAKEIFVVDYDEFKYYDGTATLKGAQLSGVVEGDDFTLVSVAYSDENAGEKIALDFVFDGEDYVKGNYKVAVHYAEIKPAEVTIVVSSQSSVYNGSEPTLNQDDYTITGVVEGETVRVVLTKEEGAIVKEGGYKITAAFDGTYQNYKIVNDATSTFTIVPLELTISVVSIERPYNREAPTADDFEDSFLLSTTQAGVELEGLRARIKSELGISVVAAEPLSANVKIVDWDVAGYALRICDLAANANYIITEKQDGTYTIQKAAVSITVNSINEHVYGDPIKHDNYTINNNDQTNWTKEELSVTLTFSKSTLGNVTIFSSTNNDNFSISGNLANAKIVVREVTVTFTNKTISTSESITVNNWLEFSLDKGVVFADRVKMEVEVKLGGERALTSYLPDFTLHGERDILYKIPTYSNLAAGMYTITASFSADSNFTCYKFVVVHATLTVTDEGSTAQQFELEDFAVVLPNKEEEYCL